MEKTESSGFDEAADLCGKKLTISVLATTDLHACLVSYDYFADQEVGSGSLAKAASLIKSIRSELRNTILLDNGDFLQGTPLSDIHVPPGQVAEHPVVAAMNHLGYDAAAIGNHEFNLEARDLSRILQGARFPLLCANLDVAQEGGGPYAGLWNKSTLLKVTALDDLSRAVDLNIGVFGVLPPQVVLWDALRIGSLLRATDIVEASRAAAADLRRQGADLVIALAHTGITDRRYQSGMENGAQDVAKLGDVDAIIAGHVHRVFPGPGFEGCGVTDIDDGTVQGKPCVMPGAGASHLGRMDLQLERNGGDWSVVGHSSQVLPTADLAADPEIIYLLAPAHQRTLAEMRKEIGHLDEPVHSYFAMVQDDRSVRLVAEAKLAEVRKAVLGSPHEGLPIVASVAPMKCGGRSGGRHFTDVRAGPIAARAVADLQFYANRLSVLQMTGGEILEWLEMSASLYNRLEPKKSGQQLFPNDAPMYNREAVYGIAYEIDLSQPARYNSEGVVINNDARRVNNALFQGAPLDPDQVFLMATNEYRAGGGGRYPGATLDKAVLLPNLGVRKILRRHLEDGNGRTDWTVPSWRFRKLPGVRAVFRTGVGAVGRDTPNEIVVGDKNESRSDFVECAIDLGKLS